MAETDSGADAAPKKKSRMPLIAGLTLMVALGGGGFYAVYSGMVLGNHEVGATEEEAAVEPLPDISFVPIEPMLVSLGSGSSGKYLHFTAQLEVAGPRKDEVVHLLPRVLDVLNGYLRAVDTRELEDSTSLIRLRAQMLRRVQVVAGEGRVRDLLITEFVIN
ncbi:MAG: flagellar basal body-associated FliL family protein [Rhodobacteraceae bacterium]|nr:flagellar basal body-associated FliL family protein [Paracoccaceae bacterium]MCP5341325.1 flagellar basal body-associated FliL family protein [Paracoccaceae bacterium]